MDEKLVINGGKRLVGTTTVGGAKNAAVAILPATILAQDVCVIENLPCIDDVRILLKILQKLGADVKFDKTTGTARIDTSTINTSEVMMELAKKLRASYYLVGAMLARSEGSGLSARRMHNRATAYRPAHKRSESPRRRRFY